jgi:hypothetical protein
MQAQYKLYRKIGKAMRLMALALVLLAATAWPGLPAQAQGGAWIGFEPPNYSTTVGGTVTTPVQFGNVSNLYGLEIHLTFDPKVVQVEGDSDPDKPGAQIEVGPCFGSRGYYYVAQNQVDNSKGTVDFAITLQNPEPALSGTCELTRITWKVGSTCPAGGTPLALAAKLSDPNGLAISHAVKNGSITCGTGVVRGKALLQGRADHSGVEAFMTEVACPSVAKLSPQSIEVLPGVLYTRTDSQGNFEITPRPGRAYSCLSVFKSGYLAGQKALPQDNVGTIALLGGDVTGDNCINIFDLARIAAHYGSADGADVNGDGIVNVYDLTLTAGNSGTCGPRRDWALAQ